MSARGFSRDPPETLKPKEWFASVRLDMQRQIVVFLLWAYGFLLFSTTMILFFQGFHAWGFNLDHDLLKWLGGATIGEIGGLLFLTFRATFPVKMLLPRSTSMLLGIAYTVSPR